MERKHYHIDERKGEIGVALLGARGIRWAG